MSPRSQKIGPHINGLPFMQAIPKSVVYTRPSHLYVENMPRLPDGRGVLPLYVEDDLRKEFPDAIVTVVREEYEVADRGTRG